MPSDGLSLSPLAAALGRVGDRWSLLIVDALLDAPLPYKELQQAVTGIATNMLAQRLRRLEAERVVVAEPYSRRPTRYSYDLTARGRRLAGALRLLSEWGSEGGGGAVARHPLCGTLMEARWYCPTCDSIAGERPEGPVFV